MNRASLAFAALLASAVPAHAARTVERIVAVINDEIVLDSELEQWAAQGVKENIDLETAEGKKQWEEHKRKVLDTLIDRRLIEQQAVELKLSVTPEEIERAIDEVKKMN